MHDFYSDQNQLTRGLSFSSFDLQVVAEVYFASPTLTEVFWPIFENPQIIGRAEWSARTDLHKERDLYYLPRSK